MVKCEFKVALHGLTILLIETPLLEDQAHFVQWEYKHTISN